MPTTRKMRQTVETAVVIAGLILALSACSKTPTETPDAEPALDATEQAAELTVDQLTLPIEVRLALLDQLGVEALQIDTDVTGREVVLSGVVDSAASQATAESVAASVDGVENVRSLIVVAPTDGTSPEETSAEQLETELADELLEGEIALRLYAELGLDAEHLEVESLDGTVTVTGFVADATEKAEAIAAAEAASGVVEVIDMVQIADPVVSDVDS